MRTTIDIRDDLYRALKARAGLNGVTLRELIQRLVEQGLGSVQSVPPLGSKRNPPPLIIPAGGAPIAAFSRAQLRRAEEEEDEEKYGRPA